MSSLQKLRKLNDICLFVDDFKGSLNFYVEKFGFKVVRLQPDPEHANYAEFEFNGTSVTLWQKDGVIEAYSTGLRKDDVYSWTVGQTKEVRK